MAISIHNNNAIRNALIPNRVNVILWIGYDKIIIKKKRVVGFWPTLRA